MLECSELQFQMHVTLKTIETVQCLHHAAQASHASLPCLPPMPPSHASSHATSSSISLLRDLSNHELKQNNKQKFLHLQNPYLSCAKKRSLSSSICESSSNHLAFAGRVNDTMIIHVNHDLVSSMKCLVGISTFLHLYGSIKSSVCGNLITQGLFTAYLTISLHTFDLRSWLS